MPRADTSEGELLQRLHRLKVGILALKHSVTPHRTHNAGIGKSEFHQSELSKPQPSRGWRLERDLAIPGAELFRFTSPSDVTDIAGPLSHGKLRETSACNLHRRRSPACTQQ